MSLDNRNVTANILQYPAAYFLGLDQRVAQNMSPTRWQQTSRSFPLVAEQSRLQESNQAFHVQCSTTDSKTWSAQLMEIRLLSLVEDPPRILYAISRRCGETGQLEPSL